MSKSLREKIRIAGPWNVTIVSGIAILFLLSLVGFFYEWFSLQLNGSHEAKLQAVAAVLGNALGVIGAVVAVLIGIELNESKEKEDIEGIKVRIGTELHDFIDKAHMLALIFQYIMRHPEEKQWVNLSHSTCSAIYLNDCELFYDQFHRMNPESTKHYAVIKNFRANTLKSLETHGGYTDDVIFKILEHVSVEALESTVLLMNSLKIQIDERRTKKTKIKSIGKEYVDKIIGKGVEAFLSDAIGRKPE